MQILMKHLAPFLAALLAGCIGMTHIQQRITSGAAIGGALACFPGAAAGAAIGAISSAGDSSTSTTEKP